jgi:hypothetical protein
MNSHCPNKKGQDDVLPLHQIDLIILI